MNDDAPGTGRVVGPPPAPRRPGLALVVMLLMEALLATFGFYSWLHAPSAAFPVGLWFARVAALAAALACLLLLHPIVRAVRVLLGHPLPPPRDL